MNPRFEANGWQAVVADQFTFSNLRMVAQAICNFVRKQQSYIDNFPPRLVIGYDSRFMGEHFAMVAAEVVVNNGLEMTKRHHYKQLVSILQLMRMVFQELV